MLPAYAFVSLKYDERKAMNGETVLVIGVLIAATWGRFFLQLAFQEIKIRRRHYR